MTSSLKYTTLLFTVVRFVIISGTFSGQDGLESFSRNSIPGLDEIPLNDRQFGSWIANFGLGNSTVFNHTRISGFIAKVLDAPAIRIVTRVRQLYVTQTDPVDILTEILQSDDMQQLISNWLSRFEIPDELINDLQVIVSSKELMSLIRVLTDRDQASPADKVCVVHDFTKLAEFRQLVFYLANTSFDFQQLNTILPESRTTENGTTIQRLNLNSLVNIMFSPSVQALLDVLCELLGRDIVSDIGNVNDLLTSWQNSGINSDSLPSAQAQALSDVANLTNLSPEELLNQFQGIISSPEIAQVIGILNQTSYIDINEFIGQIEELLNSPNITTLLQLFAQFKNGSQGNITQPLGEVIMQLVQQANNSIQVFLPLVSQFIENFWRTALTENGVSETCQDSSMVLLGALAAGETWAIQYIDAMGKTPSNLFSLRLNWLGSFDECTSITSQGGQGVDEFKGKYCRTFIPVSEIPVPGGLTVGTCVPEPCSAADTLGTLLTAQKIVLNGTTPLVPQITCVEEPEFETDAVIVTCILVLLGFIVLSGTLFDIVTVQMKSEKVSETSSSSAENRTSLESTTSSDTPSTSSDIPVSLYKPTKTKIQTSPGFVNNSYVSDDLVTTIDDGGDNDKKILQGGVKKTNDVFISITNTKPTDTAVSSPGDSNKGSLEKILLSFSAYTNGVKILSTQQVSGSLSAINGIRFLSMAWVILGHTYYFVTGYDDNLVIHYTEKLNHWTFSAVTYATVSVDSFFTISGILVAYLTLRQLKKVGGAKQLNWFMFYFHRFWRLTPPYMLIMMVATVILPFVATGPMWDSENFPGTEGCRKYWWTNLLYVNNFVNIYPDQDMCMGWTWYLANDMQFYILSPLILLPLFYNIIAGTVVCVIFLAATITTTALIAHKYEFPAQQTNLVYVTPADDYFQKIYIPCYTRMGPYIIGLFTGYLLYRLDCKCKIPKILNLLGWLISLAICCCDVYGLYSYKDDHILNRLESDFFLAFHRTGWGVAVSWIVFACATGNGGWINEVLSWKPFIPLGRLTYGAYLLHPLVIFLFISSRRNPTFFSDFEVVYLFLGHITLSYGAAFVVSICFESPTMGLEKVFFNKRVK